MSEKTASVHWEGAGKTGQGRISTETGALKDHPYGFGSRFGDDRKGTNPEEIVGAAHAACFTMAFAFACEKAGIATEMLDTTAKVRLARMARASRSTASRSRCRPRCPVSTMRSSRKSPRRPSPSARCPRHWQACPR